MRKFLKAALAGAALAGLSACTTGMPAKVSRYNQMPATTGQSFFVVPQDPAKQGSLEFQRYGTMVAEEMIAQGYAPATSLDDATMIVQVGYGVDEGRTRVVSDPFYDRYGWGRYSGFGRYGAYGSGYGDYYRPVRYRDRRGNVRVTYVRTPSYGYYRGWDDPFWFTNGRSRVSSYTEYRSELDVDIRRKSDNASLFEGTAQARSRTDELAELVPNLVSAMFTGFPGQSGETVKITVKDEND